MTVSFPLSDLEPYVPLSAWTPDTVPAEAMGEVLAEAELMDGRQVVCYWEPGSEYTKYWAVRQGDELLRFAVEDSAYAGGYSVEDFSFLLGRSGFVIEAPRGAAYTARDYYIFDENGVPRLLAGCAQPVYTSDLDGDGRSDLLWFGHGGREAYYGLLETLVEVPVIYWDERGTTVTATRYLNVTDTRGKKRKAVIDAVFLFRLLPTTPPV